MLLLDEPTNNLDMGSIRALQEAVQGYGGACIVASHDMAFVSKTCSEVYLLDKGRMRRLEGGADEYKQFVASTVEKQRRSNT